MDPEQRKAIARRCVALWYDETGTAELRGLLAPGYVHHSANGDLDCDQLIEQLGYLAAAFSEPAYEIVHLIAEDEVVALFVTVDLTHAGASRASRRPVAA